MNIDYEKWIIISGQFGYLLLAAIILLLRKEIKDLQARVNSLEGNRFGLFYNEGDQGQINNDEPARLSPENNI